MTDPDPRQPIEFEPVKLGPRRRRIDPLGVGLAVIVVALALAVIKPWGGGNPGIAAVPTQTPASHVPIATAIATASGPEPSAISTGWALVPPTWEDVRSVISYHDAWGIRTIVLASANGDAGTSPGLGTPGSYAERWVPADQYGGEDGTAKLDGAAGPIVALGVTFPSAETPLDVRIWLVHAGGDLEWMDASPINDVPARGAYLFERPAVAGAAVHSWAPGAVRSWAPGRYRVDVLVSGGIRRIDVAIPEPSGTLPEPPIWTEGAPPPDQPDDAQMVGQPVGPFVVADGALVPIAATAGPLLDEVGAWLDVDAGASAGAGVGDGEPRSFVARASQQRVTWIGVVLPPDATVQSMLVRRLAPFDDPAGLVGESMAGSAPDGSYVAFGPRGRATWHPGVYAMSVAWADARGLHYETWHIELRPGPLSPDPVLLAATRAWARYAGSSGVLLGTRIPGLAPAPGIRLLEIVPQVGTVYRGLSGSNLIGCGETVVGGRPEVIGIVGPGDQDLTPVASRILFPMADGGPLLTLTAAGTVPGLALVTPFLTAEFGGPASYGFRAGPGGDAPGYTICIGFGALAG